MGKIKFREDWIDIKGMVKYKLVELKTDEDVKDMRRSFRCRIIKGPIELDAKISRPIDDIMKMMKHPESSDNV